jgi:hypothetical protein
VDAPTINMRLSTLHYSRKGKTSTWPVLELAESEHSEDDPEGGFGLMDDSAE